MLCRRCRNRFQSFLCIDPQVCDSSDIQQPMHACMLNGIERLLKQVDQNPGSREAEELIEVQRLDIPELQKLMVSGNMLLPSVATCFMGLDNLRSQGLLGNGT